jgi:hypothetical protein
LMGRLAADRRHQNIRVLVDTPVDRRLFPQWAMAQIDPLPSLPKLRVPRPSPRQESG